MTLETERGLFIKNPPWGIVQSALGLLDPGVGNSFAVLSTGQSTYVQTLRGTNGFHLEWRVTGDDPGTYIHYRACDPEGSAGRKVLKKFDAINAGEYRDLLTLEMVISAFRSFFDRMAPPAALRWRVLDL
ncbi:hypothetical protein [Haloferula sp. A504]|uniref:hypothetical protein n=1 Tax=Haloferula sp. A504 TaxID=3373601 RepID=UPI0031C43B5F|nr:hypothetical protein [Verrucomicrobiaceae bacterium E54]